MSNLSSTLVIPLRQLSVQEPGSQGRFCGIQFHLGWGRFPILRARASHTFVPSCPSPLGGERGDGGKEAGWLCGYLRGLLRTHVALGHLH